MTTWGAVHVGDTVRGADQRAWTVVQARVGAAWASSGKTDMYLALEREGRRVEARRATTDPVDLIARADHSAEAAACTALLDGGLSFDILEETTVTKPDPFSSPAVAAGSDGVKRDRWQRYLLPDPETGVERAWTRVTTVAKTLADEYNLTLWKLRMVAKGMALRPDLVAGAAAADLEQDKKALNKIAEQAMERAGSGAGANLGTALHTFAHRLVRGEAIESMGVPDALVKDLREYIDTMKRHRLQPRAEWSERIIVIPALGVAGTFDNIVGQPSGVTKSEPLSILDLKTGKDLQYGWLEIAIQEALYVHGDFMWNPATQSYEPMPEVDQHRGLVLHLPVGKAHGQLYGVNLIEGWEYAQLAIKAREARSTGKGLGWLVDPEPADLAAHLVRKAQTVPDLAALWDRFHAAGQWTEEVNAAAAERWEQLNSLATV